jgi:hypothetical protein
MTRFLAGAVAFGTLVAARPVEAFTVDDFMATSKQIKTAGGALSAAESRQGIHLACK